MEKIKLVSVKKILKDRSVDFAVISELNTVNPPHIQNFCHKLEDKMFRGIAVYVANKWRKQVSGIPNNKHDENLELVHLRIGTVPTLNIVGVYCIPRIKLHY